VLRWLLRQERLPERMRFALLAGLLTLYHERH